MLLTAVLSALFALNSAQAAHPHPISDTLPKEAKALGLTPLPKAPFLTATETDLIETKAGRLLLNQRYDAAPYHVDFSAILVPSEGVRKSVLRSYQISQAAQFPMDVPSLKGTGLTMFSYGAPPKEVLGSYPMFCVGAYGYAGHVMVRVFVEPVPPNSEKPQFTRKKLVDVMGILAAKVAEQMKNVKDF